MDQFIPGLAAAVQQALQTELPAGFARIIRISIVARLGPLLIPSSLLVLEFPAPESASADSPPDAAGRRR